MRKERDAANFDVIRKICCMISCSNSVKIRQCVALNGNCTLLIKMHYHEWDWFARQSSVCGPLFDFLYVPVPKPGALPMG